MKSNKPPVMKCIWCGKTYEEHRDVPFPNDAVAKTPCGLMKRGFQAETIDSDKDVTINSNLTTKDEGWLKRFNEFEQERGFGIESDPENIKEFIWTEIQRAKKEAKQQGFEEGREDERNTILAGLAVEVMETETMKGYTDADNDFNRAHVHGIKRAMYLINSKFSDIPQKDSK